MTRHSLGTEPKSQKSKRMKLNETSAMEIVKNPMHKAQIQSAQRQESQLRVFTEDLSEHELKREIYWDELMSKMKSRSHKKFDRVIQFARYPLPIVQLSDSILNDFFKVFEGKNRYFNVEGDRDVSILKQWIVKNKPSLFIEKHAKSVFKNKPTSFVVVDILKNEPYLVFVDSKRLIDASFKDDQGNLEYICFIHSQEKHETQDDVITTFFSVYDEETFWVFKKDSNQDALEKVSEQKHGIGYCPAKSFIESPSNDKNPFKRRVAFSTALSRMEDWTIFDIFRNYVDHYAPFPVTEAPIKKCQNSECDGGKVSEEIIDDATTGSTKTIWKDCPVCEGGTQDGSFIYPGTHIGIKFNPDPSQRDGSGMFKMISPDVEKLKYVPEKLDDIELEIRFKTVGVNSLSNEAFNELQVKGSFASMESVLLRTKTEMDQLYIWIVKTVAKLIYTKIDVDVDANFGTEFYLIEEDDLQKRFETAKKIGLPVEEQLNIYKQLIETKYKGNTNKMKRVLMLLDLDPYPMQSVDECIKLKNESVLDDFQLSLKVNFLKFISKFEVENTFITEFGIDLPYYSRIEIIQNELERYNQELLDKKSKRTQNQVQE